MITVIINRSCRGSTVPATRVRYAFNGKTAIFTHVDEEGHEFQFDISSSGCMLAELTALERLVLAVEGAIAQRLRGGSRFLIFDRLKAEVPDDLRLSYNRNRRQILDLYTRLISDGIKSNEFRAVDPQMAAFALIGMSNWTALWYSPRGRMAPNEIASMKVVIEFYRTGNSDDAHAVVGREVREVRDGADAIEIGQRLSQTLDMPQRLDAM
jgi:hypothetical protein